MAPFETIYRRRYILSIRWFEAGDVKPLGNDLVKETPEKERFIQAKLLVA